MINYLKYVLPNGLTVILNQDKMTPLVGVNIVYKVGSKNESPEMTGLAHLFEHLMFSGTKKVSEFDTPIQQAGGENNAYTNQDYTGYYQILPSSNLDIALWLEADRMMNLDLTREKLESEKNVVIEEFHETCTSVPYGDVWHRLSSLVYNKHPYRWPTIGLDMEQVKSVTLEDARYFYDKYYCPDNAILSIAGNFEIDYCRSVIEKYFGELRGSFSSHNEMSAEPDQKEYRYTEAEGDYPAEAIYLCFRMGSRSEREFYVADLITDILANGLSSRLYQRLVKKNPLFSDIDAYITGTIEPGLLVVEGKIMPGKSYSMAKESIWEQLHLLINDLVGDEELDKVKNKLESSHTFSEVSALSRAMSLAYYDLLGNIDLINDQVKIYRSINSREIIEASKKLFTLENCSELRYKVK